MIAHCLDVELHALVPFLIDGFLFAMPGSKARMNPTARLHAFAEIRHIREGSISIDTIQLQLEQVQHVVAICVEAGIGQNVKTKCRNIFSWVKTGV